MFESLAEKFQTVFSRLAGKKTLTEENISEAVRDVRLALLDADVNYSVASRLIKQVKEKAIGEAVLKSIQPAQQFVKIVYDELIALMGAQEPEVELKGSPAVLLLCGLQGSGKTTHCVKLAHYIQKKHPSKKIWIAACDLQRPAAIAQLERLAEKSNTFVFVSRQHTNPISVAQEALQEARNQGVDVLILDTAGRLHVDEELMSQLSEIKRIVSPQETLFVASAAIGQDAVSTAAAFEKNVGITGTILTMLDGSVRAGAAISIRAVTEKPLKFEGIGEKVEDLQLFHPKSMADRILGRGDVINLVRRAQECVDEEAHKNLEIKLRKASFSYEDYLLQMSAVRKMGPLKKLLKMLPGLGSMKEAELDVEELDRLEAMILSMTLEERRGEVELIPARRHRIAKGSGRTIDDVNRMVKGFKRLKQFFKGAPSLKKQMGKEQDMLGLSEQLFGSEKEMKDVMHSSLGKQFSPVLKKGKRQASLGKRK